MSEYEVCGWGVELEGEIIDLSRTEIGADRFAQMVDGAEVVPVYRELKQEETNHETTE